MVSFACNRCPVGFAPTYAEDLGDRRNAPEANAPDVHLVVVEQT
jgi:hypothetical protein